MMRDRFIPVEDMTNEHCFNVLLFLETDRAKGSEAEEHYESMVWCKKRLLRDKAITHALQSHAKIHTQETT